jgi:alpha-L-fucosidase
MDIHSESIYGSGSNPFAVEASWGNITQKPGKLYLGIFDWKPGELLVEGLKNKIENIIFLLIQWRKLYPMKLCMMRQSIIMC